jgi:uncharacterized coiled-coil protein SlyX
MLVRTTLAVLALVFGGIGLVACLVGVYFVWRTGAQLERSNDRVAEFLDTGISTVQTRLTRVQERVAESRITVQEVTNKVAEQTKVKVGERLFAKLDLERHSETLSQKLDVADRWLETSSESIRQIQNLLALGQSLGASFDPAVLDNLLYHLAESRTVLAQAIERVRDIRTIATKTDGESDDTRRARIMTLLARIVVTISEVEDKLRQVVDWLANMREKNRQTKINIDRTIRLITYVSYALHLWIAAGQVALCWLGWKSCEIRKSS